MCYCFSYCLIMVTFVAIVAGVGVSIGLWIFLERTDPESLNSKPGILISLFYLIKLNAYSVYSEIWKKGGYGVIVVINFFFGHTAQQFSIRLNENIQFFTYLIMVSKLQYSYVSLQSLCLLFYDTYICTQYENVFLWIIFEVQHLLSNVDLRGIWWHFMLIRFN